MLTAHDNPAGVIRPRLERMGADLLNVTFATALPSSPEAIEPREAPTRPICLPDDIESFELALVECEPDLVIIDPAWAFCRPGRGLSRRAGPAQLDYLVELAANYRIAIVCVTDLQRGGARRGPPVPGRRKPGRSPRQPASSGTKLPHHRDVQRRVLLPLKMNVAPMPAGLEFRIDEEGIHWTPEPTALTAEAVSAAEGAGSELELAEHWLRAFLSSGGKPVREILRQASECGLSKRTLERAKMIMQIGSERIELEKGKARWEWALHGTVVTETVREERKCVDSDPAMETGQVSADFPVDGNGCGRSRPHKVEVTS